MREYLNRSKEHWALIRRSNDLPNTSLAIFVHGFRGNYLSTWGKIPELLEKHADSDRDLANWDFLFMGYSTSDVETYLDIASLICTNWRRAAAGESPYRTGYDRLALFGHSLGTLGIRQALCATSTHGGPMLDAVHSVTLFGTPLNGSRLAGIGSVFYSVSDALKPANPQLRMLKTWCEGSFSHRPWPSVRVVLGQGDWVVGAELSELVTWPGDATPPDKQTLDHSDLVKPDTWTSSCVMDYVRSALK